MKEKLIPFSVIVMIYLSFYCRNIYGDNFGIFVEGGYSPGADETAMDKMVDGRTDKAKDLWEKKTGGHGQKVKHKKDLMDALKNIQCKCGDVVTLFLIGHGQKDSKNPTSFRFIKDDQGLEAEELRKALTKVAVECCCKIHVVIFSCYSGKFLKELFNEDHVMSVYTSTDENELSYSDTYTEDGKFVDGGDWIKGFNEDWEADTNKTDQGAGLENASHSAKEKMPDSFGPNEHPQGWRRGEFPVYAHVSKREIDGKDKKIKKLWLHFYEPEFVRCTTREVDVSGIDVPMIAEECKWVRLKIRFGHPVKDKLVGISDVEVVDPPKENVLVHVQKVIDKQTLEVHFIQPKWLFCKVKKLTVDPPGKLDPKVKTCNYLRIAVILNNIDKDKENFSTDDDVKATDVTFKCTLHIDDVKRAKGEIIEIHVTVNSPSWVEPKSFWLPLSPEDLEKIKKLKVIPCTNIIGNVTFHTDGTQTISDMKLVTNEGSIKRFSLDAAIHRPDIPIYNEHTRIYKPTISVTNVGSETISFPVYVVICKLSEKNIIESWWSTGEGEPHGVWYNMQQVENLPNAQTTTINFNDWNVPHGNEIYWIGFRTQLHGDQNPSSDSASTLLVVNENENHAPTLNGAGVLPDSGSSNTNFNFRVTYTDADNDAPAESNVIIDNVQFTMTGNGNNYMSGVEFTLQKTLLPGMHSYLFRFNDGHDHSVNTNTFSGPYVMQENINHSPVLQGEQVIPDSGNINTTFTYKVTYSDADGDAPTEKDVLIDNISYNMTPTGNNYTTGVEFNFQKTLTSGIHNFLFRFNDGHGHQVNSNTYSGPVVVSQPTNHSPVLTGGHVIPDSGFVNSQFVYQVMYTDADNDAPTEYKVFIDNIQYNMISTGSNYTQGVIFTYQKNLTPGYHNFYFRFNDGHGHVVEDTHMGPYVHN